MSRTIAVLVFCMAATITASSQTLTTLVNFNGANGSSPVSTLIQGSDGNFYGTTTGGGANGYGTVYKLTAEGTLTTLHSFNGGTDGAYPLAGLALASDGNFYGTTGSGAGSTLFRITGEGVLTTLHSFSVADGTVPKALLLQATDGNLYGTASSGGSSNRGTLFRISLGGAFTVMHNFAGGSDGADPEAGLLQATDGNFYGTTSGGFDSVLGTVFKITPDDKLTTLYSFSGADGAHADDGVVQGKDGNFYGTTIFGGSTGAGTVFKITPAGVLTTLYDFNFSKDGVYPDATLVLATDGNFYGTTAGTGYPCSPPNCGTIFKMTSTGALTTLYAFNLADGLSPTGLVQAADGSFYGTTSNGGAQCCGTAFRFDTGLFVLLSVAKTGNGNVSGADGHIYCGTACDYAYPKGTQVTLSAVPSPGYTFAGWVGCDNVNGSYCSVTMTSARDVTASFTSADVTLTSLTFKPNHVKGGQLSAGTLTLSGPAPDGGVTVALSSDHPGVAHPPSFVFVPGGKSSAQFAVNTFPVKNNTTVTITATAGASQVSGTLMVGTAALPLSAK